MVLPEMSYNQGHQEYKRPSFQEIYDLFPGKTNIYTGLSAV